VLSLSLMSITADYKNLFLIKKFINKCKFYVVLVKVELFTAYCLHAYGISLQVPSFLIIQCCYKFCSCYYECIKTFFGIAKHNSITSVLSKLKLPSFNTAMHNGMVTFWEKLNSVKTALFPHLPVFLLV